MMEKFESNLEIFPRSQRWLYDAIACAMCQCMVELVVRYMSLSPSTVGTSSWNDDRSIIWCAIE